VPGDLRLPEIQRVVVQQELSPDFDQVAQAFARKFNWRIQPSGDAALNLLGFIHQKQ